MTTEHRLARILCKACNASFYVLSVAMMLLTIWHGYLAFWLFVPIFVAIALREYVAYTWEVEA